MTVPAIAAARFAAGCGLGMLLGIWYDLLRPLGAKRYALRDLAFLAGFCWGWMQLMFGICRGDLRPGAFFSLLLGVLPVADDRRAAGQTPVFWFLAAGGGNFRLSLDAFQKNFKKIEKFICIFAKIGYNERD